jgi:hypothetical protein
MQATIEVIIRLEQSIRCRQSSARSGEGRGDTLFPEYFILRHKPLDPNVIELVNLLQGFSIKPIETDEDRRLYPSAVQSVFNRSATVEQDEFLKQAPSCVPELNLLVWSDQHEIAAFCTVWIDPVNHYAEFEPVGTVPSFQKRGLGSALLATRTIACATWAVPSPPCNRGAPRKARTSYIRRRVCCRKISS